MRHDSGRGMGRGRKTSTSSSGHITFNKDHYLLATCQFVVIENIEHQPYLENPDLLIDWSVVEQVILMRNLLVASSARIVYKWVGST
jgi:pimeloyl-ACP methyl ester carboxylesterase